MESANFHHHQQQDDHQLLGDPSGYALAWNNGIINNPNSIDPKKHINNNINLAAYVNINTPSIAQDLGFPMENFISQELQHLARIKQELSTTHYPDFSEIIIKNDQEQIKYIDNNNQDLLLTTFANGCQIKGGQFMHQIPSSIDANSCSRGTFSQIFPTVNISSLNQSSSPAPALSFFDMNLPALDLVGSTRFDGSFNNHHLSSLNVHSLGGLFKDTCLPYDLEQMHQPNHRQEACPSNISPALITKSTESKRAASNYMDVKAPQAVAVKKSKLESRNSCPPLKVRKEKLGDRISALQQMVAPFGKTDTASVLMEAIGYIKFLQTQVETLSVPYMNSTQKTDRTSTQMASTRGGNEELRDLRSRGLCLVPLSCLSYVTYGGGSVWPTP